MTIADVLGYPEGSPVNGLTVRVDKAFKLREGGEGEKAWKRLDLEVSDSTGKVTVNWWAPETEDGDRLRGQTITLTAAKGSRGMEGAKTEMYKDKPRLSVRGRYLQVGGGAPAASPAPATAGQAPAASTAGRTNGAITFEDVLRVARRAAAEFKAMLPGESVTACVNTVLIAFMDHRIAGPVAEAGSAESKPETEASGLTAAQRKQYLARIQQYEDQLGTAAVETAANQAGVIGVPIERWTAEQIEAYGRALKAAVGKRAA